MRHDLLHHEMEPVWGNQMSGGGGGGGGGGGATQCPIIELGIYS